MGRCLKGRRRGWRWWRKVWRWRTRSRSNLSKERLMMRFIRNSASLASRSELSGKFVSVYFVRWQKWTVQVEMVDSQVKHWLVIMTITNRPKYLVKVNTTRVCVCESEMSRLFNCALDLLSDWMLIYTEHQEQNSPQPHPFIGSIYCVCSVLLFWKLRQYSVKLTDYCASSLLLMLVPIRSFLYY